MDEPSPRKSWRQFLLCALLAPLAVACTVDVDYGDTVFSCEKGQCPPGYQCVAAICQAEEDIEPPAAPDEEQETSEPEPEPEPDPIPDPPAVSCELLFGEAPGYVLCEEDALSCSFNVNLDSSTCNEACERLGSTCLGAIDNTDGPCNQAAVNEDTCDTPRSTEICVCAR